VAGPFLGSPRQLNRRHESDAELLRLPSSEAVLAVTTDAIVEEIAAGLYQQPWLIGWMGVTVNASDLAAVGAEPLGVLMSVTLPADASGDLLEGLRAGIGAAALAYGLPLLGGDTNRGPVLALGGTALGLVRDGRPLTRCGARPGDCLMVSGPVGLGAAHAFERMIRRSTGAVDFRPVARLREGPRLRGLATACMDTSDGLIATLDELARRNGCGFRVTAPIERVLHPEARRTALEAGLPPWLMLAGPHGEFELVFTVPPEHVAALRDATVTDGWVPQELGRVTAEPGVVRLGADPVDTGAIRNLFDEVDGNVDAYLRALMAMA
jgi:thiamine-monophosphate kinase